MQQFTTALSETMVMMAWHVGITAGAELKMNLEMYSHIIQLISYGEPVVLQSMVVIISKFITTTFAIHLWQQVFI